MAKDLERNPTGSAADIIRALAAQRLDCLI